MTFKVAADVEASILQALDLHVGEAARVLADRIDDGSWTLAQGFWFSKLAVLAYRDRDRHGATDEVRRVLEKSIEQIVAKPLGELAIDALPQMFDQWLRPLLRATSERRLITWFTATAGPGEASIAADVLECASHSGAIDELTVLCDWLLANGASELRARRRMSCALLLVSAAVKGGRRDAIQVAARYVFMNDERLERIGGLDANPHYQDLLRGIDMLCEASPSDGPELVAALSREFNEHEAGRRVGLLATDSRLHSLRVAAMEALAHGFLEPNVARVAWGAVVIERVPSVLVFAKGGPVMPAIEAFTHHVWKGAQADGNAPKESAAWGGVLAQQLLSESPSDGMLSASTARLLDKVVAVPGREVVTRAIRDEVRAHATRYGFTPVSEMLDTDHSGSGSLAAAIRLMTARVSPPAGFDTTGLEAQLVSLVESILVCSRAQNNDELRSLLKQCERMAWATLANDDKVAIDGVELRVDLLALRQALNMNHLSDADRLMAGVLYVVHEVVHLCQRIGDKSRVAQLRATGAETTLMHVDLGADHSAASLVARAICGFDLLTLKDVQGRSASAFPTNARHTTAARARKAQRLVGLRADVFVRRLGVLDASADEYVFVEFGPGGGEILFMRSGPPWGVIGAVPLSRSDAALLYAAAEPTSKLTAVDCILSRVVQLISSVR